MKRSFCFVLSFLLCVTLFCGCVSTVPTQTAPKQAAKGAYSQTLSDSLRAEIVAFYGKEGKYDDEDTVAGKQYYGTYNGYVILMDAGQLDVLTEMEIAGRVFQWGSGRLMLDAYKDGQVISLKELYQGGGITEADLDQILENHKAHFSQVHNWDYDAD